MGSATATASTLSSSRASPTTSRPARFTTFSAVAQASILASSSTPVAAIRCRLGMIPFATIKAKIKLSGALGRRKISENGNDKPPKYNCEAITQTQECLPFLKPSLPDKVVTKTSSLFWKLEIDMPEHRILSRTRGALSCLDDVLSLSVYAQGQSTVCTNPTWPILIPNPYTKGGVVAFATFVNHQSAMAALHSLNGVKFDPQTSSVLHIELARSNSRRQRKPGSGAYVVIDKRTKATDDAQENSSDGDSETDELSGDNKPDSGDNADLTIPKSGETVGDSENAVATENEHTEKTVDGVSLCSTLFIANLGPNCTEDEMKQVLSQYPGFKALKVRARGGMPVAFADFEVSNTTNMTTVDAS
ncbi:prenylated RAB acceptor 1.F4 [Actinidia rufa]|uniref:Prenylated RAB acceptor 1.F4 n=1 Tax=Actinidia rufa TaxID=165716 RepID=A0A7J0FEQ9_9ERIC|nr:prenylated RAB acceptor 1.F4 [Actinidia rufa]